MTDQMQTTLPYDTGNQVPSEGSNEVAGSTERRSAIPAGIKYGLVGLLFFVFVIGAVVVMSIPSPDADEAALVFEEGTPIEVMGDQSQTKDSHAQPTPELSTTDPVEAESSARFDQLMEKVQTLESSLHDASALIAKQADAVARQGGSIEEVMLSLTQSRALMSETLEQLMDLKTRLASLETRVEQHNGELNRIKTKSTRKPKAMPAFELLSIDQWGGQESVVLALQDQTTIASLGDNRAGWTIHSIDRPNCIGVVRQRDQAKAKVCKRT